MNATKLAAVLAAHADWTAGRKGGKRANLTGVDLSGSDLCDANLRGANLYGANLTGADLRGVDLTGVDLSGANLRDANLYDANLYDAKLCGANLTGADLRGAKLRDANLRGANLYGANLTGVDLRDAKLRDAILLYGITVVSLDRRAIRTDGYEFFLWNTDAGWRVKAGCRFFDLDDAWTHWERTRGGTPLGDETLDILTMFQLHVDRAALDEGGGDEQ